LASQAGSAGQSRPSDEVAVRDGLSHGEVDIRAASKSDVRASSRVGAALLSFQDSSGREDLRAVAEGGDWLIGL